MEWLSKDYGAQAQIPKAVPAPWLPRRQQAAELRGTWPLHAAVRFPASATVLRCALRSRGRKLRRPHGESSLVAWSSSEEDAATSLFADAYIYIYVGRF